jgi:hypothetical protein
MAFLPPAISQASLLDLIVERLRKTKMSDWIKMLGSAAIAVALAYSMLQQHDYRINKLEDTLETHLIKHESQSEETQRLLRDLAVQVARIQK